MLYVRTAARTAGETWPCRTAARCIIGVTTVTIACGSSDTIHMALADWASSVTVMAVATRTVIIDNRGLGVGGQESAPKGARNLVATVAVGVSFLVDTIGDVASAGP